MRDIVQVDGSPGTVAALLRHGVNSPRTAACMLHMSGRSMPYYRRPVASMSYTHLISVIRYVCHVTYVFNTLLAPRALRGYDGPDARHLGNALACPGAESHWARGDSGALPHQEAGLELQDM
jgi:hypothetical protein